MKKTRALTLIFYLISSSCLAQSAPTFAEVTAASGIDFQYTFGDYTYENIMESSGAGISILDYNQDGFYDIYLLNGTYLEGISSSDGQKHVDSSNKLYRNNGDGSFTEVSQQAGLDNKQWSMAAGVYDFDHDGDEDIYLANYGPNVFYLNNGNGTFTDITEKLGLEGPSELNGFTKWSVSVAFLDYNQDRRTDILVGNFLAFDPDHRSSPDPTLMPHPGEYKGQASLLYQQKPDGTFKESTQSAHLLYPDSKCMGLTVFDVDQDGDMDIFQSNDHQPNFLLRNEKGVFKEVGIPSGVAVNNEGKGTGSMHGSLGDIDGDGHLDILVTDLKHGSLYRNTGLGIFKDVTYSSGVAPHFKGKGGWAAMLSDFDNDGDLDIFSANGTAEELILQPPLLLENNGKGRFVNSGKTAGTYFQEKHSGRGAAVLDYDNDGDLDIIISHLEPGSKASLLENTHNHQNHWLGVTIVTSNDGTSLIGTKITLVAGSQTQVRVFQPSTGYLSYSDPRIHFGMGTNSQIDEVKIEWPDGAVETLKNVRIDQYISVGKGIGIVKR
ncbi:MAG: CRTAC1 family protein [Cyclobacteriaceae bacterium]|nr:CRTAC1 family protein [Cyclobacteriaceae bacterium]